MRLVKRTLVLAARVGTVGSLTVLLSGVRGAGVWMARA